MKMIKARVRTVKVKGDGAIKAKIVLSAWKNYCRESRIYRILEWFGLR
tara:strand:+ start:67 stop:210 length:144 start_codon:yes stop_codon:yes gene_type:complete